MRQPRQRNIRPVLPQSMAPADQDDVAMRARAYALTPTPLIPFGSFVPRPRRDNRQPKDRR